MAANVENMFSVRENVWHDPQGEFTVAEYPADWAEARTMAGLDWEPIVAPAYVQRMHTAEAPEGFPIPMPEVTYEEVPGTRLVTRSDTGSVLGHVTPAWTPVNNSVLGEFAEALIQTGDATTKITTAGCLNDGRQVWMLVQLDEPFTMAGDDTPTFPYLAVMNSHDGTGAFMAMPTMIRVVCSNTYHAAEVLGERNQNVFRFKHSANVMARVDEARAAIAGVRSDVESIQAVTAELAGLPVSNKQYLDFVSMFIPSPAEHGEQISDRVANNIDEARTAFGTLYNGSPTCDANRGTGLGLYHASVEYLDHIRGARTQTTRLRRSVLSTEKFKARAVVQVREACLA